MVGRTPQSVIVAALADPALHGGPVEHRETHISHVFLTRDRAYKLKKEMVLPFLDYGSLERRRFFCREEVRLNRPLAPSVYHGVCAVIDTPSGFRLGAEADTRAVEYVVEMRRFDEESTLRARLLAGRAGADTMRRLGAVIARLHAQARPSGDRAGAARLGSLVESELDQLRQAFESAEPSDVRLLGDMARAFVDREREQVDGRAQRGLVRVGHGDLRLEHVLLDEGIELIDCVEFDVGLRTADVAYDLAFLVMELHDVDARELAAELVAAYRAAGGDPGTNSLLHGLAGCRALVRAKIAAFRTPAGEPAGPRGELLHFIALARRLLWLSRCPLVLVVGGPAATGKTTLATALARASGLPHLSSDRTRKRLAGAEATAALPPEAYTAEMSAATYEELGRAARERVTAGLGAVVDATFRFVADRKAFDRAFADASDRVFLRLDLPIELARERALARMRGPAGPSDAGPDLAAAQHAEFEPLSAEWRARSAVVRAGSAPDETIRQAERAIDHLLPAGPAR